MRKACFKIRKESVGFFAKLLSVTVYIGERPYGKKVVHVGEIQDD